MDNKTDVLLLIQNNKLSELKQLNQQKPIEYQNYLYETAKLNKVDILDWLIVKLIESKQPESKQPESKESVNWDWILNGFANGGHLIGLKFAVSRGAKNFKGALEQCFEPQCLEFLYNHLSSDEQKELIAIDSHKSSKWSKIVRDMGEKCCYSALAWVVQLCSKEKIKFSHEEVLEFMMMDLEPKDHPIHKIPIPDIKKCIDLLYESFLAGNSIDDAYNGALWCYVGIGDFDQFKKMVDDPNIRKIVDIGVIFESCIGQYHNIRFATYVLEKYKDELSKSGEFNTKHIFDYVSQDGTPEDINWLREQKEFANDFDPEIILDRASVCGNIELVKYAILSWRAKKYENAFNNCNDAELIEFIHPFLVKEGITPDYKKHVIRNGFIVATDSRPKAVNNSKTIMSWIKTNWKGFEEYIESGEAKKDMGAYVKKMNEFYGNAKKQSNC